jgi:hypothetical protein
MSIQLSTLAYHRIAADYMFGRGVHYFVEEGVAKFCEDAARFATVDYFQPFPDVTSVRSVYPEPGIRLYSETRKRWIVPPIHLLDRPSMFFHFPARDGFTSSLGVLPLGDDLVVDVVIKEGEKVEAPMTCGILAFCVSGNENDAASWVLQTLTDKDIHRQDSIRELALVPRARLLCGLSLYIHSFPDAVVRARDELITVSGTAVVDSHKYKGNRRFVLEKNEIVREEARMLTVPHWRKGFWRLYKHPKFVNVRGQIHYIEGCMVRGQAAYEIFDDAPPLSDQVGGGIA